VSSSARTILLSCGEASGDLYAAEVATALRRRHPTWRLVGVVGPRSLEAGVEPWADIAELSVMGFGEIVRHLPRLWALGRRLVARAEREGVDLFLPVDYPGFHLRVAARMRGAGIPVLDLIPPKTWSWGRWRLGQLRRAVDRCAVIFPFELQHYRQAGVRADFVGHPLPWLHREELAGGPGGDARRQGLLLVPGSREQEIRRLAPVLVGAVRRWRSDGHSGPVRLSRAPTVPSSLLQPVREELGEVEVCDGPLFGELRRARLAIVCSGTATVEAALAGCPHLIVYRTGTLTHAIARRLATVDHIGMANIVLGREAFPEFVQGRCRPDRVFEELSRLDGDATRRDEQRRAGAELVDRLRGPGCFDAVADLATEMLLRS
jgi:lipid-A-disaccharide synthase